MKIIGFVGMPGSGKSAAADVARDLKIPVVVMGDVIREEAARRNLEPTDRNLGAVGNDLREKEGPAAIAARCLEKIREMAAPMVVVEGIRSKFEVDLFRRSSNGFQLIEVFVPDEIRLARIASRGRSDDANDRDLAKAVADRDARELSWGRGQAIRAADLRIENAGGVAEFRGRVREVLEGGREGNGLVSKSCG
jgi:dephospho-CoA kinase